jgi:hypothetical protein
MVISSKARTYIDKALELNADKPFTIYVWNHWYKQNKATKKELLKQLSCLHQKLATRLCKKWIKTASLNGVNKLLVLNTKTPTAVGVFCFKKQFILIRYLLV